MKFVNCTMHPIDLNDGTVIPTSDSVARVAASFTPFDSNGLCGQVFGTVTGLPDPKPDTFDIVSAMVLAALTGSRPDVVAPATGHPDCNRKNGRIMSVPGFVQ